MSYNAAFSHPVSSIPGDYNNQIDRQIRGNNYHVEPTPSILGKRGLDDPSKNNILSTNDEGTYYIDPSRLDPPNVTEVLTAGMVIDQQRIDNPLRLDEGQMTFWRSRLKYWAQHPKELATILTMRQFTWKQKIYEYFIPRESLAGVFHQPNLYIGRTMAEKIAYKMPVRSIGFQRDISTHYSSYSALAFSMDLGDLSTPEGPSHLNNMSMKLNSNLLGFAIILAFDKVFEQKMYYVNPNQVCGNRTVPTSCLTACEHKRLTTAIVNRHALGIYDAIRMIDAVFKNEGRSSVGLFLDEEMRRFVTFVDEIQRNYKKTGRKALINRTQLDEITTIAGKDLVSPPMLGDYLSKNPGVDILRSLRSYGTSMSMYEIIQHMKIEDYRTYMRHTGMVDFGSDDFVEYSILEGLEACESFVCRNKVGGMFRLNAGEINYQEYARFVESEMVHQKHNHSPALEKQNVESSLENIVALDTLLSYNPHWLDAGAMKRVVDENVGPEAKYITINAFGELPEVHCGLEDLTYMYKTLMNAAKRELGMPNMEALKRGEQLLKMLGDRDPGNFHPVMHETAQDYGNAREAKTDRYYYMPNAYGGPNFANHVFSYKNAPSVQTNGNLFIFDPSTMAVNNFGGYRTIPAVLTLLNDPLVSQVRASGGFYAGALVFTSQHLDELNIMQQYIEAAIALMNVFSTFFPNECFFSVHLLPEFNYHKEMNPIHQQLIVFSNIILGPFYYPVALDAPVWTSTGLKAAARSIRGQSLELEVTYKDNNIKLTPEMLAIMDSFVTNPFFASTVITVSDFRLFSTDKNLLSFKTLAESFNSAKTSNQTKQKKIDFARLAFKNNFVAVCTEIGSDGNDVATLFVELASKVDDFILSFLDTTNYVELRNALASIDLNISLSKIFADAKNDQYDNSAVTDGRNANDAERQIKKGFVVQLHFSTPLLKRPNFRYKRVGLVAVMALADAANVYEGGIWGMDSAKGPVRYSVEIEPVHESAFYEEDAMLFGGTIFTALAFVSLHFHCMPRMGRIDKSQAPDCIKIACQKDNGRINRFASGYPVQQLDVRKRGDEEEVIKEYMDHANGLHSLRYYQSHGTYKHLPQFVQHCLANPPTGNPRKDDIPVFEKRWAQSYLESDMFYGICARVACATRIHVDNFQAMAEHHIVIPLGIEAGRKNESKYMKDLVGVASKPCGTFYWQNLANIVGFSQPTEDFVVKGRISGAPVPKDFRDFFILGEVMMDKDMGGKFDRPVNEFFRSVDGEVFDQHVNSKINNGPEQGKNCIIFYLTSYKHALRGKTPIHYSMSGRWNYTKFATYLHRDHSEFKNKQRKPQMIGLAFLNHIYNLHENISIGDVKEATRRQIQALHRINNIVSEGSILRWDILKGKLCRLGLGHHFLGYQGPGMQNREQSVIGPATEDLFGGKPEMVYDRDNYSKYQ